MEQNQLVYERIRGALKDYNTGREIFLLLTMMIHDWQRRRPGFRATAAAANDQLELTLQLIEIIRQTETEAEAAAQVTQLFAGVAVVSRHLERAGLIRGQIMPHVPRHCRSLIDFGCGDGLVTARGFGQVRRRVLFDITDYRHHTVRQSGVPFSTDLGAVQAPFDLGLAIRMLHHCADPDAALDWLTANCTRLIIIESVAGGLLADPLQCLVDWIANRGMHALADGSPAPILVPGNYRTQEQWMVGLGSRGFEIVIVQNLGIDTPGSPQNHCLLVGRRSS